MARLDPFWESKGSGNWADGVQTEVGALIEGGNFGYAKQIEGWVNNMPYTSRPLRIFLLEAPLGFRLLPDGGAAAIATLRSLVETIAHKVTGFQYKLTVDVDDSQSLGGSGQKYGVYTNVKEDNITINFSWWERRGLSIMRFLRFWIQMLMMDPETKFAGITTVRTNGRGVYDSMPDMWSMSLLAIEMDVGHSKVVQSWLCFNVWPTETGDNEAQFDKDNPSTTRELTIPFNCNYQYGPGVDYMAQKLMDSISLIGASEFHRKPIINGLQSVVAESRMSYSATVRNISSKQYR